MAKSSSKFNLTQLLNERSKEIVPAGQQAEENENEEQKITEMDVTTLMPSKDNFYSVDDVADLKQSIELMGVLQPFLVSDGRDGKYHIIAGHRRRAAVMELIAEGKERFRMVPVMIKPAQNAIMERLTVIMANRFREKTDWEKMTEAIETESLVIELKKQIDIPGRTRDLLAEIISSSPAQLGRYKATYNNLSREWMEIFKAGKIGVSIAYEISGLSRDIQLSALHFYQDNGDITLKVIAGMKRHEERHRDDEKQEKEPQAGQQAGYVDPQPETVRSICYDCTQYSDCHDKKETVTSCNAFVDKHEAYKTDAERYDEEQAAIDKETKKRLREMEEQKTDLETAADERIAPEQEAEEEKRERMTRTRYEEITEGALRFLLVRKNGHDYKVGEKRRFYEAKGGELTARYVEVEICYVWDDGTGLEDGYCIIGFENIESGTDQMVADAAAQAGECADAPVMQPAA